MMAILATLAGFVIGNYRVSAEFKGREFLASLQNQQIILAGKLSDDPDTSKSAMVAKLQNLQIFIPSSEPVENSDSLVENFCRTVENFSKNVERIDQNVENYCADVEKSGKSVENPSTIADTTKGTITNFLEQSNFLSVAGSMYVTIADRAALERSDLILLQGKLGEGFGTYVGKIYRAQLLAAERAGVGDIFAKFKRKFAERVSEFVPSPEVDLGMGYLMGAKSGLPEDFAEALQAVGMTHVVVASGAHLAILIGAAKKVFGRISKFAGTMFALLMILAFVLIVGFTPSMTRAALVASLSLMAGYVGRKFTPLRLIALVAMITLLLSPTFLLNLGWQLSFASFFGILIVSPRITRLLYGGKKPPWLASMLVTSVSTSLICAPILIYNFGSLSFLALVANLIILPTLPYAMLLMLLTGVASFWPFLASIIAQPTIWLLDLHIWVVNFLSEQTTFIINPPSADIRVFLIYLPVLVFLVGPVLRRRTTKRAKADVGLAENPP